jgi:hypothetical protein
VTRIWDEVSRGSVVLSDSYKHECDQAVSGEGTVDVVELRHSIAGNGPMVFEVDKGPGGYGVCPGLMEEIRLFLSEDDDDWELTITRKKMKKFDFDNLPEFPGW